MATTSPDNIRTPNPNDNFNLIADWATTASDVQAALVKRANMYVGTSAQRAAFTTAPEGVHWQDTDGVKGVFVRQAGSWEILGPRALSGSFTVSLTANSPATQTLSFPVGVFTKPPTIQLTGGTGITAATGLHMWVSGNPSTTSASVSVVRGTSASQTVHWTAIQPAS